MNEHVPQRDRQVTYKALNSEAVSAARAAAAASGLTTEEWLTRTILENASEDDGDSGVVGEPEAVPEEPVFEEPLVTDEVPPYQAADYPDQLPQPTTGHETAGSETWQPVPEKPVGRTEALAQHLLQAKAAADVSGVSVTDWLNGAILDSARAQSVASQPTVIGDTLPAAIAQPVEPAVTGRPVLTETAEDRYVHTVDGQLDVQWDGQRDGRSEDGNGVDRYDDEHVRPLAEKVRPDPAVLYDEITGTGGSANAKGSLRPPPPPIAMDPLQERLARIVAARREEQQRLHPEDPPMLLATRPPDERRARAFADSQVADFDEMDRRRGSNGATWFYSSVMVILLAIAGLIWMLPYIPQPTATASSGVRPSNGVAARIDTRVPQPNPAAGTPSAGGVKKPSSTARRSFSGTALARVPAAAMPKPPGENADWYRRASVAGNHNAQLVFAQLLLDGKGVKRDPVEAVKWLKASAGTGNVAVAQYRLGVLYERGTGVRKSLIEATLLFQRAAGQGHVQAISKVGVAYLRGRGLAKDFEQAHRYLERAAEAGEMNAQFTLGRAYEDGIGVKKDRIGALKWYILAAQRGHRAAAAKVENMPYSLPPNEREKASQLAREHNDRYGSAN